MHVSDLNLRSLSDPSLFFVKFVVTAVVMEQVSIKREGLPAPPLLWRHSHVTNDITQDPTHTWLT
jgi:hypothetical protein